MSFVCLVEIHLHFPENGSLKGKRKELVSLKSQLQRRFGASVSETAHHDRWQRATLTAALVGGSASVVDDAGAKLARYVEAQFPQGVRLERGLISAEEVLEA
ncbi:MAG: DUF503 domain-containing protein [Actinobacteria bacterium]|nr:MAG: DUF503 domain-containing protein [Actinomycetota bacterium]TMM10101.1 MAG: DUF503 domain-containing protein [Actinomycetota bacterium]